MVISVASHSVQRRGDTHRLETGFSRIMYAPMMKDLVFNHEARNRRAQQNQTTD